MDIKDASALGIIPLANDATPAGLVRLRAEIPALLKLRRRADTDEPRVAVDTKYHDPYIIVGVVDATSYRRSDAVAILGMIRWRPES